MHSGGSQIQQDLIRKTINKLFNQGPVWHSNRWRGLLPVAHACMFKISNAGNQRSYSALTNRVAAGHREPRMKKTTSYHVCSDSRSRGRLRWWGQRRGLGLTHFFVVHVSSCTLRPWIEGSGSGAAGFGPLKVSVPGFRR